MRGQGDCIKEPRWCNGYHTNPACFLFHHFCGDITMTVNQSTKVAESDENIKFSKVKLSSRFEPTNHLRYWCGY